MRPFIPSSLRIAAAGALLASLTCAPQAEAAACQASGTPKGQIVVPETAYLLSALPSLVQAALSSTDLTARAASPLTAALGGSTSCTRPGFTAAGATFVMTGADTDPVPRIALRTAGAGAVAVLATVPVIKTADGPRPLEVIAPSTVYVAATVSGTQVAVWAVFDAIPDDRLLAQVMQRALTGGGRPLLRFDPLYNPGSLTGLARYVLPPA